MTDGRDIPGDTVRFLTGFVVSLIPVLSLISCGGSQWYGRANRPPVADAGADVTVYQGRSFHLDGSRSSDTDGRIVSYRWVQTEGKAAVKYDPTGVRPEVVAPFLTGPSEEIRFQLTVTDNDGRSGTDVVTVKVIRYLFYDDFRTDTTRIYSPRIVGPGKGSGQFRHLDVLGKVHANPGHDAALSISHAVPSCDNGTFSFVFTPSQFGQNRGKIRVFLLEDLEKYYELFNSIDPGSGGLRKVVDGTVVESVRLKNGYSPNVSYPVKIVFSPESTIVDAFQEIAVMNEDREPIRVKRFEIRTERGGAYYDDIAMTQDPFLKVVIPNRIGLWDSSLQVQAIHGTLRKEWKIRFILDENTDNQKVSDADKDPFQATFLDVGLSTHAIDAYIIDGSGNPVFAHDRREHTARDGNYVAVGDSITRAGNDHGRTGTPSQVEGSRGNGYGPILETLLESAKGYPHTIVNQGIAGHTSADGLNAMPSYLAIHPEADYFLILYGTNDSAVPIPSGKGLNPGDREYRKSYKDNMQRIIALVLEAGKTPILGKVPIVLGEKRNGNTIRYGKPDRAPRNVLIREYNSVIDELIHDNRLPVSPPDFYAYFRSHRKELSDGIHPNRTGYRSMAKLWFRILTRGTD